ncbi:MAG: hypothetical protein JWM95_467 [Gemmatimonadetes bacterium]|nr:hypothetical protein [Gemmatimonadota bacterium]
MHHLTQQACRTLMHIRTMAATIGFVVAISTDGLAQAGDTTTARELTPGVSFRKFTDATGPWTMYLVRVDLRRSDLEIRPARAHGALKGRETVSAMARRATNATDQVVAAVNGDFFELKLGENENNQVIDGEWWKGVKVTDSPYDTYDNTHTQLAFDTDHHPTMDRYLIDARAWSHGTMTPIMTVNFNQVGNPEGTVLYTSRFGATTPRDTARITAEAALAFAGRRGDTVLYVRVGAVSTMSGSVIPSGGAVLSAYGAGSRNKEVLAMPAGDTVKVLLATIPRTARAPTMIIGGWPRILRDGIDVAADAPTIEGTISRNAEARHPRTAVGFSRDSSTLFLFAVDGRSENSGGMTLTELAAMMRKVGAWQAMNFDGGGSTTMVIDGVVVNKPTDATGEREVGNALLVVRKR